MKIKNTATNHQQSHHNLAAHGITNEQRIGLFRLIPDQAKTIKQDLCAQSCNLFSDDLHMQICRAPVGIGK